MVNPNGAPAVGLRPGQARGRPGPPPAIDEHRRVTHIYQGDQFMCWAAAIGMMRGGHSIEAAFRAVDLAREAGLVVNENIELPREELGRVIRANHLTLSPPPSPLTPQSLVRYMGRHGCALFVRLNPGQTRVPSQRHVYVLSGLQGDGTPAGTLMILNDPYRTGRVDVSFQTFTTVTIHALEHIAH